MLAIVIPYYKKTFFRETMESIASQTSKDFILYIGNDASTENPQDIIEEYKDKIQIVYHRFDENFGSKDLVAQWARCIDMTNGEDWIWLFSDDDIMENTCVEEFYYALRENHDVCIMRYKKKFCNIIDGTSYISNYKKGITLFSDFVSDGLDLTENHVTMPEFLFHRALYMKYGIVNIPLAWGSDKITYLQYVLDVGFIYNLSSIVYYRYNERNISSNKDILQKEIKLKGRIETIKWHKNFFKQVKTKYDTINVIELGKRYIDRQCYFLLVDNLSLFQKIKIGFCLFQVVPSYKSFKGIIKSIINRASKEK